MKWLPGPVCDHESVFRRLMSEREELGGGIAEFGVYNGGSTRQLAQFGRVVYAFDTFSGMPCNEHCMALDQDFPGSFRPTIGFQEMFEGYPLVVPIKGRFKYTLRVIPAFTKFALVYLDCDLYASYQQVLEWLPDHLLPNSAIVADDYSICRGATKAVNEFLKKHALAIDSDKVIVWNV